MRAGLLLNRVVDAAERLVCGFSGLQLGDAFARRFAAERVGFLVCRAGRLTDGGLVILATGYDPVSDEDYVDDPSVGAMMGPAAIRKALERAYNGGAEDLSLFHVHMHGHRGRTGFSEVDDRESRKFVPDFFNVAPAMPHGDMY